MGYHSGMYPTADKKTVTQLRRIEGQVRGILGMVEEGRYCIDVLTQIAAVRASLHRVEKDILKNHISCCVGDAFRHGNAREQRGKIDELVTTLAKLSK